MTATLAQSQTQQRPQTNLPALDGLRGVAALMILIFHALVAVDDKHYLRGDLATTYHSFYDSLLTFSSGVLLFFVLSGFLLFLPYARAIIHHNRTMPVREFYWRRILRIVPGYYAALFVYGFMYSNGFVDDLVLHPFFIFNISATTFSSINGTFWTIAVEVQFYVIMPLLAFGIGWLYRHGYFRALAVGMVAVCGLTPLLTTLASVFTTDPFWHEHWSVFAMPTYLPLFLMGGAAAFIYVLATETDTRIGLRLRRLLPLCGRFGLVVIRVSFVLSALFVPPFLYNSNGMWSAGILVWGLGFAVLVLACATT